MANPLAVGGAGLGAYGSILETESLVRTAKYNKELAEENARITLVQGAEQERRQRVIGAQALGDIKAGYAASGVSLEGSALDVLAFSAANVELDALTIRYEASEASRAFRNEAKLAGMAAKSAKRAGKFNLLSSAFSGGAAASKTGS